MYLLITLLLLNSVSVDQKVYEDVNFQADRHIQGLLSGEQRVEHYWFLVQMSRSSDWIHEVITIRLHQLGNRMRDDTLRCLARSLTIGMDVTDPSQNALLQGYKCMGDVRLLILALYDFEPSARNDIVQNVGFVEPDSRIVSLHLDKALHRTVDLTELYEPRPLQVLDIHLFHETGNLPFVPNLIIDHWHQEIINSGRPVYPLDVIRFQSVVTGLHTITRQFDKVYQLLPLVENNRHLTTSVAKHVMYKRLAFSATLYGYYQTALRFYRNDLLPLSRSVMPTHEYLTVQQDYSVILYRIGNVRSALESYIELYNRIDEITDVRYRSSILNNLAVSYLNSGYFDQYLQLQLEAFDLAKSQQSIPFQLQILNNLYIYHKNNNDWNRALIYLDEAYEIANEFKLSGELFNINISRATYYRDLENQPQKAIDLLIDVINNLSIYENYREITSAYSELAISYGYLGDFNEVENTRIELFSIAESRNDTLLMIESISGLAYQAFEMGKIAIGIQHAEILKSYEALNVEFWLKVQFANIFSQYHFHRGEFAQAIHILEDILPDIITRVRMGGDMQGGTILLEKDFRKTFTLLTDLLLSSKNYKRAIEVLDEFKNLNKAPYLNSQILKSTILTEEQFLRDLELSDQIEHIRNRIRVSTGSDLLDLNNTLSQLLNEQNQINNLLLANYDTKLLSIDLLTGLMGRNDQIINITAIDSVLYVAGISRKDIIIHRYVLDENKKNTFESIIGSLTNNVPPDLVKLYAVFSDYISPSMHLDLSGKVYVIPDSYFYQLPLEIMPIQRPQGSLHYGSARYMIEKFPISYHNSISDIIYDKLSRRTDLHRNRSFLGVAVTEFNAQGSNRSLPPLPNASREVKTAFQLIGKKTHGKILLDSEANKTNVFNRALGSHIIHIASHSEVNQQDALFSLIHLSADNAQDQNYIYAYELFNLNLNADMMVLSSCDSGAGTYVQGSGIIGLGRALKFAGARSLVLNAWSIKDDTAAQISEWFYQNLARGLDKDEALRLAKIRYINSTSSNPAEWGTLILYGDTEPLFVPIYRQTVFQVILFIVITSMVFIVYRRYFK